MARDRRAQLIPSTTANGIDFVTIGNAAQTVLQVHLNAVSVQGSLTGPITITGGETIPTVNVLPIKLADWGWDGSHAVLILRVAAPGDFSHYLLTVDGARQSRSLSTNSSTPPTPARARVPSAGITFRILASSSGACAVSRSTR
jgi:hypothetical protein